MTTIVFHKGKRVASHARSPWKGGHSTIREHMPPAHLVQAGTTRESLLAWADRIGPSTAAFMDGVITSRAHPQQAFRSCPTVLRLAKTYGEDRLESACHRAVTLRSFSFKSVDAILKNRLDQQPLDTRPPASLSKVQHKNVRGGNYYATPSATRDEEVARRDAC